LSADSSVGGCSVFAVSGGAATGASSAMMGAKSR
jgi:hypothetical protein